jgi:glyoxylase-like metal-dependent hydrolase (beta-lactamase superfamily II)
MFIFKFPSGPFRTNAILIGCPKTKRGAVLDPSFGSATPILQKAAELDLKIEKILLTHSHWDHIADVFVLKEKTQALIYLHSLDAKNLEEPGSDGLPLLIPIRAVKVDYFLNEGDVIHVGDLKLEVIHTPGHSPGGVCFFIRSEKVLFSGDTLFQGTIGNLSLPTAEPERMWPSLKKLSKLPADTRVIPGHGGETMIGNEEILEE